MSRYNNYEDYYEDDYQPRASTEIYNLRREGRLDEAIQKAEDLISNEEADYDVYTAYAWSLIDLFKRCQQNGDSQLACRIANYLVELSKIMFEPEAADDEFAETLVRKIKAIGLSVNPFYSQIQEAENFSRNGNNVKAWEIYSQLSSSGNLPTEAHERYGWVIYRYLRDTYTSMTSKQVRSRLRDYIVLKNERPSLLHSQILNFALNYSKQDDAFRLVSFLRLWGPENLRNSDFEDSHDDEGKSIPSLMARIARAVVNYPYQEIQEFVDLLPRQKDDFILMLRENYFWKLYRSTEGGVTSASWDLFEQYLVFYPDSSASIWHSKVLSLAERIMKDNNAYRFYDFFRRWNPEKLRYVDWQEEKGDNGETYKPLALKALKKAREALDSLSDEQIGDLQWLIDLYGVAIEKFPDDDWNIRSKALLHLRAGQLAKAKSIYKELCLKMGEKYYIWQEFSDCWKDNSVKIALLCKALSLEIKEDFLGKIRLELARQLITAKKYENAAVELNLYKAHYSQMGWRIDPDADHLIEQCSSVSHTLKNNDALYSENIPIAEECAYADIPYTKLVLIDKWNNNEGKEYLTFVDGDLIEITTTKKRFPILRNSHKGQVWCFKLYKEETIKTIPSTYPRRQPRTETIVKYIPLIVTTSEEKDWFSLPDKYGIVQHINEEKKVYHIYSTESILVYEHYERHLLSKGDFIKFKQYKKNVKDEAKVFFCDIQKCEMAEALENFKSRIVAVDDVNENKQLFHFVLGPKLISGILHYDQTELRPSVGDCIKIYYYVRKIEDKKNPGHQKKVVEVIKSEATNEINSELIKHFSGYLELKYKYGDEYGQPSFAFVGDYYVHKSILDKYAINEDCHISGKAIYAGDNKWKVFEITSKQQFKD